MAPLPTSAATLAAALSALLFVDTYHVIAFTPSARLLQPLLHRPSNNQNLPMANQHQHQREHRLSSASSTTTSLCISSSDIQAKLKAQMTKLQERDRSSREIPPDELDVIYEDENIAVINKPSGVLTVPGKHDNPSLNKAAFERFGCESNRMDKMVVHRLGMDASGLVVFARTNAALRELNTSFRTRKVARKYEVLVCGHVANDNGMINLPLMRDYECPPYMRVSTEEHQRALIGLDPVEVGKKILESPKPSLTEYEVIAREELDGKDVTRLALTSISGRTHQLNVHCAAIGHPIVGDTIYGYGGEAAANGGLDQQELPEGSASEELQKEITEAMTGKPMCVHAKSISFEHPITRDELSFECEAPF
eukprot:CAMPEP_0183741788 /NCGR_PEP_ID=MMETSP0737-20130205/63047_1 /TAXON_ID=385413 /ORGANISM="Thalassiosira miniscula, Strain CCMP1093" /LENGTH=365 /DNA_ID=CAMNT_0025977239 /DNA_START=81 /DNA_END=1178 /DNA_ORIENTATION=-